MSCFREKEFSETLYIYGGLKRDVKFLNFLSMCSFIKQITKTVIQNTVSVN